MRRVHKLSCAQLALIPLVREEWQKIGLDTSPVEPAKVREILGQLYGNGRKPAPSHIIHLASPLEIALAIGKLRLADNPVCHQVSDAVSAQVKQALRQPITNRINEQVAGLVTSQDSFEFTVAELVPDLQVIEHIQAQLREPVRDRFPTPKASSLPCDFGQFDVSLAWFDFVGRLGVDVAKLVPTLDLAKACGWAVLFWDWAFVSAKPEYIQRDEQGRLHCETGAALRYPDGFSVFALHGSRVPEKLVMAPETITVAEIEGEWNVEVRRMMLERYGIQRFLFDSGAKEIHRDDFGILYRKDSRQDEPLVMVKVVNATPEPDGSYRDYFLRVPPTMKRARQAVAWTFAKAENDYSPTLQT